MKPPGITVITPTIGRPTLAALRDELLPQFEKDDEWLVIADGEIPAVRTMTEGHPQVRCFERKHQGCWGHHHRNWVMPQAHGTHLMFLDDDDRIAPWGLATIRKAIAEDPGKILLFKSIWTQNRIRWSTKEIKIGNVGTHMWVVPNQPTRLGTWGARWEGDYDFIASTVALYPEGPDAVAWRTELITIYGCQGNRADHWSL